MNAFEIGFIILFVVFFASLVGMALGRILPTHHVDDATREVIKVSMAVLGTMTALVIGFLISSANTSFSSRKVALVQDSAVIVRLDGLLRHFGPQADTARDGLRNYLQIQIQDMFPTASGSLKLNDPGTAKMLDQVEAQILALQPENDQQTWYKGQALTVVANLSGAGWQVSEQNLGTIPLPFLVIVVVWLCVLFASFGMFAPKNPTVIVAFFLCAFSIASGIKIILDLNTPFGGRVQMSGFPLRLTPSALNSALRIIEHPDQTPQP